MQDMGGGNKRWTSDRIEEKVTLNVERIVIL